MVHFYKFLDKKNYESEDDNKDNKEYKKLFQENSEEFLFCGYVDFEREINGIRGLNIKMEEQKKDMESKIEAQKNYMEAKEKQFETKIYLLQSEINNLKRNANKNKKNNSDEISEKWQLFRRQRSRMRFRFFRRQHRKRIHKDSKK